MEGKSSGGHPPKDVELHKNFYSTWETKNGDSCCNDEDCYPTAAEFDSRVGLWKAKRREDGRWLLVPKYVFDPDTDEAWSPDGRPHLCAPPPEPENNGDLETVRCFKPGASI